MKCRIDRGGKQVFTPNNERSKLFDKLYNIMGKDFQKALDVYSITETPEFKDYQDVLSKIVPNARVESTDPIVFQSVLERLQQSGLSDNIFQLNTEQLNQKLIELGVSAEVRNQIQAWHGSPHLFQKFSTQFMGSGEGVQAFGWGLYFTDLESIARNYADVLGNKQNKRPYILVGKGKQELIPHQLFPNLSSGLQNSVYSALLSSDTVEGAIEWSKKNQWNYKEVNIELEKLKGLQYERVTNKNLYNVTLHKDKTPDQYTWLEWDKPITEDVIDNLKDILQSRMGFGNEYEILSDGLDSFLIQGNGKDLYNYLSWFFRGNNAEILNGSQELPDFIPDTRDSKGDKEASLTLLEAGIDGIKYPAESISRGATSDTARGFNYVVFDENAVTIEEIIQFQKDGITLVPNGFVVTENGKRNIYLNSDNLNLDTLLHENGHLFLDTLKQRFPEHYQAGLELLTKNSVEAQPYIDFVNTTQPSLERYSEAWKNEVLAQIIGSKGEQLIKSRKKNTIKDWLNDFWDFIAKSFGLTSYTPSEVANMTLQEFSDAVNVEMLRGESLVNERAFNEGVTEVQRLANEYKKEFGIDSVQHNKVGKLFPAVSRMIAEAYEQAETEMTTEEVKEAYKALENETLQQYSFIIDKGLKVSRWLGEGEPYANSKEMLKDLKENNHLYFLPNSEAFGKDGDKTDGRFGLKPTDVYLEDGYRMTLSEVFRVVHDYFGHGILGNQFGAIGEENATLQHLDLYSYKALPAVVFQTRGQNSWVNFSGVNDEALRKIREGSKTNNENLLKEGQKEFVFATPKDSILPKIFNFKTYETARRINEQEEIRKSETYLDPRGTYEDSYISELLSRNTSRNSGKLNGFSRRSLGVSKRLGGYDVDVVAEYEGNQEIESLIKNVFPQFKGTQKIYEISNGEVYRELMIEALETNKFKSSVTVHSAKEFSNMRLFVTEDGSTGITLTKEGFLGGAFGNPKAGRPNNLAQMMLLGIKEGAITAEAFDTVLPNYYSRFGFKAVSRTAFNEEHRPLKKNGALEDWDYELYSKFNNGRPDVVFFIYDGGDRNTIQDRLGQFDSYSTYQKDFTEYFDKDSYDGAYRFMEVEAINKGNYQETTNPDIRFQIIGEIGAEALDRIEDATNRIDNLNIAKQMTESGKTPLEIRLATGWELGVDGKWRYEVDDLVFKDFEVDLNDKHPELTSPVSLHKLGDVVENGDLIKAYPNLKDVNLVFTPAMEGKDMMFYKGDIFINYEKYKRLRESGGESILQHEVYHALAKTEQFGDGGSPQQFLGYVQEYIQRNTSGNSSTSSTRIRRQDEILDKTVAYEVINGREPFNADYLSFVLYSNLEGEVSARNVQARLLLTPEQRRNTLLRDTMDVAPEDQLVIFDAFEQADSISYETFQNNNLRSHMFVQNGTRLGSLRTKPVKGGEKIDSVIIYEDYRNQGLGTELYLETIRNLMIEGKKLYSDDSQTAPARKIWENLVNMGLAIQTSTNNFETVEAPSWMTPETTIDEVINNEPIDRSEPSLQELMNFINTTGESTASKSEVIELMQASNIIDSQDLKEALAKAEEQGVFIFTEQSLKSTGIFDRFEIYNILESKDRQKNVKEVLKWLRTNDDFEIQPTSLEKGGTLQNSGKIQYQAEESEITSQDINGNIIKSSTRLSETITFDYNETLSNNIAFLRQIVRESTWDNLSSQVKDILEAIEISAIDNGIDLIGLREKYHSASREDILSFLDSLEQTLEETLDVGSFENMRNEFLNFSEQTYNKELSNTEVLVSDNLPQDVAYTAMGLLKVSPLVYKRVPQMSYEELLTIEAQRLGIEDKTLNQIVNRNFDRSIEDTDTAKTLYLLRNNLNAGEAKPQPNTDLLNTFNGNFEYITEQFTKDFGKWLISSKNTMFQIDYRGITLTDPNQSELAFESVPTYMQEDLLEYSKLSKHLNFNRQFEEVLGLDEIQVQRDEAINNPESVKEYFGDYVELNNEDAIIVRNGQGQFIRVEGVVFEQVEEQGNLVYYKPLPTTQTLMEIDIFKPSLSSSPYEYTAYQTVANQIENLNRRTNRTDYEC